MRITEALSPRPSTPPTPRTLPAAVLGQVVRSAGVLAVLSVPLVSGLGGIDGGPLAQPADQNPSVGSGSGEETLWKAAWSERYPGCVPAVLWPADERPVAVVTLTPDGRVDRVALDAQRRLVRPVPATARTVGACR